MGEVIHDERFLHRWGQVLLEAEQTREFALRKIGQFTLQLSGQMELPFGQTIEGIVHPDSIARGDEW